MLGNGVRVKRIDGYEAFQNNVGFFYIASPFYFIMCFIASAKKIAVCKFCLISFNHIQGGKS